MPRMGILIMAVVLALAWIFALLGWSPPGAVAGEPFADSAMRWLMFMPVGLQFLVSAFMHTVLAKKTSAMIGWQTNGFQYEIGFVSLGIGIAGLVASFLGRDAWLVLSIVVSVFLLGAAANHIKEMIGEKNFKPGNSMILVYDIGLPVSLWAVLIAGGML